MKGPRRIIIREEVTGDGYRDRHTHDGIHPGYKRLSHPTGFEQVEDVEVCYSPIEYTRSGRRNVDVHGQVLSRYTTTGGRNAVDVAPIEDAALRAKIEAVLRKHVERQGTVNFI